ncbi:MAG TPA: hypothetical protein VGC42_26495, partial [Kofleriaceae bacterium]
SEVTETCRQARSVTPGTRSSRSPESVSSPRLLLLDEPAGGLNHDEAAALGALIRGLRDELGLAILIVEHHLGFVMQLSDRVVALDFGKVLAQGTPAEIAAHPDVIRSYLGTPA